MTGYELLKKIQEVIAQDSSIVNWCQDKYERAPSVWIGVDERAAPTEDDYPIIGIVALEEMGGRSKAEKRFTVYLGVGVVQEEIEEDFLDGSRTKTHKGMIEAENLRELVRGALLRARIAMVDGEGESATESFFPLFVSYQTLTFTTITSRRRR